MENRLPRKAFARLRLKSAQPPYQALGARVTLQAGGVKQQDYVRMTDGFQSQVPSDLHFGLGGANVIDILHILWPSGAVDEWRDLPVDHLILVREGEKPEAKDLPRWPAHSGPDRLPRFSTDLSLERLEGGTNHIAEPGRTLVLNFWSPTCAPCKRELPRLAELSRRYGEKVAFRGVCVDARDLEAARAIVKTCGIPYPQYVATSEMLSSFFGDSAAIPIPATFVFDGTGNLRRIFRGEVQGDELSSVLESFKDQKPFVAGLQMRGERLIEVRRYKEALAWLDRAVASDPNLAGAHLYRGVALFGLGRLQDAISALRRAVELDSENGYARQNLAIALREAGLSAEAVEANQAALRLLGDRADVLLNLALAACDVENAPVALDALERALAVEPRSGIVWRTKGKVHFALGQLEDSRRCLLRAIELDPSDAESKSYLLKVNAGGR
ncbi:MAG: tetratricopeptide repeat protein [Planctomycetes bacterium]|nr:tetratricopeptide repeat protein [Planctomycetota bacterium]